MAQRIVAFTLLGVTVAILFLALSHSFRLQGCYETLGDFAQCDALYKSKSGFGAFLFSPYFALVMVGISFLAGWLMRVLIPTKSAKP